MKTRYRILPVRDFVGVELYLQFERVRRYASRTFLVIGKLQDREDASWRFIYMENYATVGCGGLSADECPEHIVLPSWRLIKTYVGCEFNLTEFAKKWPNIEDYFAYLRKKRQEHLDGYEESERNRLKRDAAWRQEQDSAKVRYLD